MTPTPMRPWLKVLLVIEVVVCFGPMTLMLMMGLLMIPMQIVALFGEEGRHWDSAAQLFGTVGGGVVGIATFLFLLVKLLEGRETIGRPWLVFAGAIIGAIPLIDVVTDDNVVWRILGAMPIVAGLHVLFLSRQLLLPPRVADHGKRG